MATDESWTWTCFIACYVAINVVHYRRSRTGCFHIWLSNGNMTFSLAAAEVNRQWQQSFSFKMLTNLYIKPWWDASMPSPYLSISNRLVSGRLCASDTFKWMHFKHRFRQSEPAVDKTSCPHEITLYCMIRSTTLVQVSRCCVTAFIFLLWYKGYAGVMRAYYWRYVFMWFSESWNN